MAENKSGQSSESIGEGPKVLCREELIIKLERLNAYIGKAKRRLKKHEKDLERIRAQKVKTLKLKAKVVA